MVNIHFGILGHYLGRKAVSFFYSIKNIRKKECIDYHQLCNACGHDIPTDSTGHFDKVFGSLFVD